MSAERNPDVAALEATLTSIEKVLDVPRMQIELGDLEAQAGEPNLWDDPAKAQQVTSRMSAIQADLNRLAS
ncbi:MAG: peptide chain release factor 2, partial [Actinomycetota bacterium]|nr:peptide chain release factor 2 [Actinomycetota bacterium]